MAFCPSRQTWARRNLWKAWNISSPICPSCPPCTIWSDRTSRTLWAPCLMTPWFWPGFPRLWGQPSSWGLSEGLSMGRERRETKVRCFHPGGFCWGGTFWTSCGRSRTRSGWIVYRKTCRQTVCRQCGCECVPIDKKCRLKICVRNSCWMWRTLRWCLNLKAFPQSAHLNLLRTADSSWEIMWRWSRYTFANFFLHTLQVWKYNDKLLIETTKLENPYDEIKKSTREGSFSRE